VSKEKPNNLKKKKRGKKKRKELPIEEKELSNDAPVCG
jgi:hypothetical protein